MRWMLLVAAAGMLPSSVLAQSAVPAGTLLPVTISNGLDVKHVHPGQQIRAEVMQSIPGTPIKRRSHVLGNIVSVTHAAGQSSMELRFTVAQAHGSNMPIRTSLRAIASFIEVQEAQVPEEGASRGITPEVATTRQIGGDQVYRGGGPAASGETIVGRPTAWGVLGEPRVQRGARCHGVVDGNTRPQAFWLFSTDACGVYGLSDIRIEHAGRSEPSGTIMLRSTDGELNLRGGAALLLRVLP